MAPEKLALVLIIITTFLLLFFARASGLDRCQDYSLLVRNASIQFLGPNYPYHYNLGQLQQESNCRANVTAFDGGMGISQMMLPTYRQIEKEMGQKMDPYNAEHGIKMQAFYMGKLDRQNKDGRLFLSYMYYNSGSGTTNKEYNRAEEKTWLSMKETCKRKVLTLKNGSQLDLCDVGYDYPNRIYRYGQKYKVTQDKRKFW